VAGSLQCSGAHIHVGRCLQGGTEGLGGSSDAFDSVAAVNALPVRADTRWPRARGGRCCAFSLPRSSCSQAGFPTPCISTPTGVFSSHLPGEPFEGVAGAVVLVLSLDLVSGLFSSLQGGVFSPLLPGFSPIVLRISHAVFRGHLPMCAPLSWWERSCLEMQTTWSEMLTKELRHLDLPLLNTR